MKLQSELWMAQKYTAAQEVRLFLELGKVSEPWEFANTCEMRFQTLPTSTSHALASEKEAKVVGVEVAAVSLPPGYFLEDA